MSARPSELVLVPLLDESPTSSSSSPHKHHSHSHASNNSNALWFIGGVLFLVAVYYVWSGINKTKCPEKQNENDKEKLSIQAVVATTVPTPQNEERVSAQKPCPVLDPKFVDMGYSSDRVVTKENQQNWSSPQAIRPRGWYDVSALGVPHDFCRSLTTKNGRFACVMAGTDTSKPYNNKEVDYFSISGTHREFMKSKPLTFKAWQENEYRVFPMKKGFEDRFQQPSKARNPVIVFPMKKGFEDRFQQQQLSKSRTPAPAPVVVFPTRPEPETVKASQGRAVRQPKQETI